MSIGIEFDNLLTFENCDCFVGYAMTGIMEVMERGRDTKVISGAKYVCERIDATDQTFMRLQEPMTVEMTSSILER